MTEKNDLLENIVLGEIEGKNCAILAYEGSRRLPASRMGVVSLQPRIALGARYVDRSYVRRKFRVVHALDRLIDEVASCAGDYRRLSRELLRVAGDNPAMPNDGAGYREASGAELSVYLIPFAILVVVIALVVRWIRSEQP